MALFKSSDPWSGVVIVLTAGLFVVALFVKGFTHALFLETGVLLVSVKLILMAQKNAKTEESLQRHLARIEELLLARTDARSGQK
jgi:type III secretory pathway component EscV